MSVPAWEQSLKGPPTRVLYGEVLDKPAGGLIVTTEIIGTDENTALVKKWGSHPPERTKHLLCLFKLNMLADGSLAATVKFKCLGGSMDVVSGVYMGYKIPNSEKLSYIHVDISSPLPDQLQDRTIKISFTTADSRLVEFGVYCLDPIEDPKPLALCQILSLTIKPSNYTASFWRIDSVRVTERFDSPDRDKRLAWQWSGSHNPDPARLPWSKTTGPFSYFDVMLGGKELGRAYCLEYPIHREDLDGCEGEEVEVIIHGRLFGGGEIVSLPMQLSRDEVGVL